MVFSFATIGEGEKREKSPKEMVTSFIEETLDDGVGSKEDLGKIVKYLKKLPKTDQQNELLNITFRISVTSSKQQRKYGGGKSIVFRVVIDSGDYSVIPLDHTTQGFDLLDELSSE